MLQFVFVDRVEEALGVAFAKDVAAEAPSAPADDRTRPQTPPARKETPRQPEATFGPER
jgi:hypothetical protein